jgi:hypothetical protein
MSDTPGTDNLARGNHVVPTEFARDLERERNQWRACAEKLESFVYTPFAADEHAACAAALAEFKRLKESGK